jgi:opacity protein-like surface antigen
MSLALAQTKPSGTSGIGWRGWGAQVGLSSSPDQIYGGVHFNLGEFAKNVRFRTTVDAGFGDDETLLQALAEVHYVFPKKQVWTPYVGGGAGLTYVDFDKNAGNQGDGSSTEFALAAVGGIETRLKSGSAFYFEGKIGIGDEDPDFKVGVGWTWK